MDRILLEARDGQPVQLQSGSGVFVDLVDVVITVVGIGVTLVLETQRSVIHGREDDLALIRLDRVVVAREGTHVRVGQDLDVLFVGETEAGVVDQVVAFGRPRRRIQIVQFALARTHDAAQIGLDGGMAGVVLGAFGDGFARDDGARLAVGDRGAFGRVARETAGLQDNPVAAVAIAAVVAVQPSVDRGRTAGIGDRAARQGADQTARVDRDLKVDIGVFDIHLLHVCGVAVDRGVVDVAVVDDALALAGQSAHVQLGGVVVLGGHREGVELKIGDRAVLTDADKQAHEGAARRREVGDRMAVAVQVALELVDLVSQGGHTRGVDILDQLVVDVFVHADALELLEIADEIGVLRSARSAAIALVVVHLEVDGEEHGVPLVDGLGRKRLGQIAHPKRPVDGLKDTAVRIAQHVGDVVAVEIEVPVLAKLVGEGVEIDNLLGEDVAVVFVVVDGDPQFATVLHHVRVLHIEDEGGVFGQLLLESALALSDRLGSVHDLLVADLVVVARAVRVPAGLGRGADLLPVLLKQAGGEVDVAKVDAGVGHQSRAVQIQKHLQGIVLEVVPEILAVVQRVGVIVPDDRVADGVAQQIVVEFVDIGVPARSGHQVAIQIVVGGLNGAFRDVGVEQQVDQLLIVGLHVVLGVVNGAGRTENEAVELLVVEVARAGREELGHLLLGVRRLGRGGERFEDVLGVLADLFGQIGDVALHLVDVLVDLVELGVEPSFHGLQLALCPLFTYGEQGIDRAEEGFGRTSHAQDGGHHHRARLDDAVNVGEVVGVLAVFGPILVAAVDGLGEVGHSAAVGLKEGFGLVEGAGLLLLFFDLFQCDIEGKTIVVVRGLHGFDDVIFVTGGAGLNGGRQKSRQRDDRYQYGHTTNGYSKEIRLFHNAPHSSIDSSSSAWATIRTKSDMTMGVTRTSSSLTMNVLSLIMIQ